MSYLPPKWPSALNGILDGLQHGSFQKIQETPMNDGSVRQRAIGTGAPMLHGTIDLTGPEWSLIKDQAGVVFELPDGTVRALFFGPYTTRQTGNTITSATVDLRLIQKLSADTLRAAKEEIRRRQGDL